MDEPEVAIQSGWADTAARSARALVSGETLSIAGHSFLVAAEGISHASELAVLVGGFSAGPTAPTGSLSLVLDAPAPPPRRADETYDDIELWRDGETLTLRNGAGVAGWADRTTIVIGGSRQVAESVRTLFLPLVTHVLAHRGTFVIHGGAVDAGNGALLLVGASGAGKSTLAGLSLGKDWDVLGDDIVALSAADGQVRVVGVPRPPAVPVDAAPDVACASDLLDARDRRHLDPEVLDTSSHAVIGTVLPYPATGDEDDHCQRLPASEVLHHLIGSFTSATTRGLLTRFLPVAAAVARSPGYTLPLRVSGTDRLSRAGAHLVDVESRLRHALL